MADTVLETLQARLMLEAVIDTGEAPFTASDGAFMDTLLTEALARHNADYSFDTLPSREYPLVIILARIRVCDIRAQRFANDPSFSGTSGYGQDRNTPFYKTTQLIKVLQDQYASMAAALGVEVSTDAATSAVHVSTLRIMDSRVDAYLPTSVDLPPVPTLSIENADPDDDLEAVILAWVLPVFDNFHSYRLAVLELAAEDTTSVILQPWNEASTTGIAGLNNSVEIVELAIEQTTKQTKLTGLTDDKNYRFVLVVTSRSDLITLSNEVVLEREEETPP
jgi:hypothetical protein